MLNLSFLITSCLTVLICPRDMLKDIKFAFRRHTGRLPEFLIRAENTINHTNNNKKILIFYLLDIVVSNYMLPEKVSALAFHLQSQ